MKKSAFLAALLAVPAAHAVVAADARAAANALDAAWSAVGQMSGASAVAIGPHLVLTAGHVGAGSFTMMGKTYRMTSTEMAPMVGKRATDLRLVRIKEALPMWYDVATSVKKRASVTLVGYGATGVVADDGKGYVLTGRAGRTAGTNTVSAKGTLKGVGPALRAMVRQAGDAALAVGDSGGGWFVDGALVGISDFTFSTKANKAQYGFAKKAYFGSGAIDLTHKTIRRWLDGEIAGDATASALVRVSGVQAVPEPGTYAALGLGAALFLRRRRAA